MVSSLPPEMRALEVSPPFASGTEEEPNLERAGGLALLTSRSLLCAVAAANPGTRGADIPSSAMLTLPGAWTVSAEA